MRRRAGTSPRPWPRSTSAPTCRRSWRSFPRRRRARPTPKNCAPPASNSDRLTRTKMPAHKDLGAILVEEDVLDAKDLGRVADSVPLWQALIERELATAEQIFRALSKSFGVPVVSDERLA